MKRFALVMICVCALAQMACAQNAPSRVPARRDPIEVRQPDGAPLTILLRGDERKHWTMTEDGYLIAQNSDGYYCYKIQRRGEQVIGRRVAKNPEDRTKCDERYLKRHGIKK